MCGGNLITGLTSAVSPRVDISSTCKVGQKLGSVSPSVDMLPFGVTIPAAVLQRSEIPEGLMTYAVHIFQYMLEETDAIVNEVLEPIRFVLAYPTIYTHFPHPNFCFI
jgi:hypothetical protein